MVLPGVLQRAPTPLKSIAISLSNDARMRCVGECCAGEGVDGGSPRDSPSCV